MPTEDLRTQLRTVAPNLIQLVDKLTSNWVAPVLSQLGRGNVPHLPKIFNDAVWGTIELLPCEVLLLDSPLLQRLRGIRQLGLAHLVYPGAGHDRLEHSRGVVEPELHCNSALTRNAENRKDYTRERDTAIPMPSLNDRVVTRLGALLHDVGHAPFSHATEYFIARQDPKEFNAITTLLQNFFEGVTSIAPAEQMTVLIIMSNSMRLVFDHPGFDVRCRRDQLAEAISARVLGSRSYLNATYLSGVVSGPLDADKIDYMARDSHHAGLPLGLDITRLVSKLEVVAVTPENALNPELKKRAEQHNNRRFYELGIARAGLAAYEQMLIARVTLYERLYYHHKVKAAEGMVSNLIEAMADRGEPPTLHELYESYPDDAMIDIWGGFLTSKTIRSGGARARALAQRLRSRTLLHRAYSFSSRFIAGLDAVPKPDDTKAILWSSVTGALETQEASRDLARAVCDKARRIGAALPQFQPIPDSLVPEHIVIDLPDHTRVARGGDILTTSAMNLIGTPNLYFNAEKWADAYMKQKQCGYVFAPREALSLVALASRIVFYERFELVMGQEADISAKMHGIIADDDYDELARAHVCSAECVAMLRDPKSRLARIRKEDLAIPDDLAREDPELGRQLAEQFSGALPEGLPASVHRSVVRGINAMLRTLRVIEQGGNFVNATKPDEKRDLQPKVRDALRVAEVDVIEGAEYGGGETDLLLDRTIVLENKVLERVEDPFAHLDPAGWQARRYSIAISQKVRFIVAAYCPRTEQAILPLSKRVRAKAAGKGPETGVEVHFLIPYGHGVPSRASLRTDADRGGRSLK